MCVILMTQRYEKNGNMQVFQAENIKLNQEKMRFSLLNRIISKNGLHNLSIIGATKREKTLSHEIFLQKE